MKTEIFLLLLRKANFMKWARTSLLALIFATGEFTASAQTLQTLVSFNGTAGSEPNGAVTLGADGNFYGMTALGGSSNDGVVFKMTANGKLTILTNFNGANGANPQGALTPGTDGNFYGAAQYGGTGSGIIFKVTTNGTLTVLYSFTGGSDGSVPLGSLTPGTDGNFYGTTDFGGSSNDGVVFKVTTNGTMTTLVSFNGANGAGPWAALTPGTDGNFYGTTSEGGSSNYGVVFKVTTNGTLTALVSFNGANGAYPLGSLTLGADGNFYGTTQLGGSSGDGTVFKVTTNGTLTTLVNFNGTDGAGPRAGLTLGIDGNFYGTTQGGGSSGDGTVFQVTPNGVLTTLVSFNGANGNGPFAGSLTLGTDGNFYGTTQLGGSSGNGTVFGVLLVPIITVQPQSQTNYTGSTVVFTVMATNPLPADLSYQWQKNGTNLVNGGNISGANTNTLTLTAISDGDAASYSVIVSNAYGTVTSSNATLTVNDLPFVTIQPLSQTIGVGSNVTFTATAYGAPPFIFQWYYNNSPVGSPASGTNVSSYALTNVQTNQSGNYSVFVINGLGSVMSSNALLTVVVFPPSISTQPSSQSVVIGSNVSFNVSVSGMGPFNYQWYFNGTNILNATNATYAISSVATNNAGNYFVVITNSAGGVTSSNALLTVLVPPVITAQPSNRSVLTGTNVAFGVSLTGTVPFLYQWQFNGTNILNATNATYAISSVATNNAGFYSLKVTNSAGSSLSSNAALTVVLSPNSRTNIAGSTATFTASAFSPESLSFQWRKNGTNLVNGGNVSGATNSVLTLASVQDADAANYSAVVNDTFNSVATSNATLTVIDPPVITAQPTNLLVLLGTNVSFGVSITSSPSFFSYQWQFNGTNILNATNATYAISSVATNNAGFYSLTVTNLAGSSLSSNAVLTVVLSPNSQTNIAGSAATFTTIAFGPESLYYQWQKNGTNLINGGNVSGATNSVLTLASVQDADAANYSAIVSDTFNSVATSDATLTVIDPPTMALHFSAGYPVLNLNGMLNKNFIVQYSTNLAGTNWITLRSLTNLPFSPYQLLDPAGIVPPARFYRALMQ
jgi:uncharacterized repeat protein (TIGR03803 family)